MTSILIAAEQLADWLAGSDPPVVLDARARLGDPAAGAALWREGHIPGALHADMDRDLAAPPTRNGGRHPLPEPADFAARLRGWGITPRRGVVVYDDTGGRLAAARAWWLLTWAGHPAVHVLDGGWPAWRDGGFTIETQAPTAPQPSDWQPDFNASMIATPEDVARGEATVIDARAGERYRGESEPMDARAGHIPGAVNVPGATLLTEQQHFIDSADLAAALPKAQDNIAYCGSGVSACQVILAYAQLGRSLPQLYPGSWSAWSADPARPAATGPDPG
jgi:thiosulfate/3-mercaptopyruvate sulfurtransferase